MVNLRLLTLTGCHDLAELVDYLRPTVFFVNFNFIKPTSILWR